MLTTVLQIAPFAGSLPTALCSRHTYSAIRAPVILALKRTYGYAGSSANSVSFQIPVLSLTYIPSLSASGSVAIITSASTFFARSIPMANADGSSGFGDLTVLKSPSGTVCSSTTYTCLKPSLLSTSLTGTFPVP